MTKYIQSGHGIAWPNVDVTEWNKWTYQMAMHMNENLESTKDLRCTQKKWDIDWWSKMTKKLTITAHNTYQSHTNEWAVRSLWLNQLRHKNKFKGDSCLKLNKCKSLQLLSESLTGERQEKTP